MSYTKREWATGNVVGAVDLNRMEEGIEDAGSGQILVVTDTDGTLDKTWQEIYDAFPNVYIIRGVRKSIIRNITGGPSTDCYITSYFDYSASTPTDYPQKDNGTK